MTFAAATSAFADDLEKGLRQHLQESRSAIAKTQKKLQAREAVVAEVAVLKSLGEKIRASHLLMRQRLSDRSERVSSLGAKAVERQSAIVAEYNKAIEEYLALIDAFPPDAEVSQSTLEPCRALLDRLAPPRKRPLLGTLPYKHLSYPASEPASSPSVIPAYRGGDRSVKPADTAASAEAPITSEISSLAESLQWNPVLIYEWVKNNVETEWYWGVMKGAEETLRQRSGNSADQSALLVSLLRASGFPARFVKGTIEFFPGIDQAKEATGIADPVKIADFLRKAGIPFKPVIAGGGIANLQLDHVWVECQIPYSNYRGAVVDDFGKSWLGLDTTIKSAGYTRNTPLDIPVSVGASVPGEYLPGVQDQTPLEMLKAKAGTYLDANQPGKTWQDLLATQRLNQDIQKILPSSMQFKQVAITGEYTELPVDLRHRVRFSATANGNELFSMGLDAMQLSNRRIALGYEPESVEDQQIIDSYGGLDNTPSYLVRLRPVIKLDGERVVVARDGLPMGGEFTLTTDMLGPNGTESVTTSQVVGNLAVIGIVGQRAKALAPIAAGDDAESILFKEAIGYIDRWNRSEEELAAYHKVALARPVPTTVTVGGVIDVSYLLDIPHGFEWKGVFIDAALRGVEVTSRTGAPETEREFMRLSALQGSVLEARIFEDDLKVGAVSTAKVLQLAAQQGVPILSLDKSNVDTLLPGLSLDSEVKSDIANAVNQNLSVKVPQAEIAYQDWTGVGYLKENTETGESGWMLSGQLAGGMTAWRADLWPEAYAAVLQNAYSEPPVAGATGTSIAKITGTEFQRGEVGKFLPLPLQVRVTDSKGRPVIGAEVTFTVKAGGGSFAGNAQTLTALSNVNGVASAPFTLGKYTKDNPTSFWEPGDDHPQQVGENIVDASLASGAGLPVPFSVYGFPGKAVSMRRTYGDALYGNILSFASFVAVVLEDSYGNQISNLPVTFTVADPVNDPSASSCPNQVPSSQKSYLVPTGLACLTNAPVWGECGNTSQQTLNVSTGTYGAPAQIIMGGMPSALYRITATCTNESDPAACIDPATGLPFTVTFNRYTRQVGTCSSGSDPVRQLYLDSVMVTDETGRIINAGRAGGTVPIRAKLYYLREGETLASASVDCSGSTLTCNKISGSGGFAIDSIDPGSNSLNVGTVAFGNVPGTRLPESAENRGLFVADYPLEPGVNKVVITGTGTVGVQSTTMTCPSTCSTSSNSPFTSSAYKVIELYGVGIQLQNIPTLQINKAGELDQPLTVSYDINPPQYRAGTAHVVVYRQEEPVAYITAETSGHGTAILARGFRFDMQSSYAIEVVLNQGSGVEIKSGKIPVNLKGAEFEVERHHLLAKFDGTIPAGVDWSEVDSYRIFNFIVKRPTSVKVLLLDADLNQKAVIVPQTTLPAGNHDFVLDYGLVKQAGFNASTSPKFNLQVLYAPTDGNPPYMRLFPGTVVERSSGRMLGQVMVHDVLIQDGSLNLSRQDFSFKGRGPQLSFSRSYNNQDSPVGPKPMGEGWRHSLDMKLYPISAQSTGAGPVPDWVNNLKGKFFGESSIPQAVTGWTTVQVSEGTFRKYGNAWYTERGRHGKLEEVTGGFLFTAKDGTRYRYDYPTLGATPVRSITDRNGNVMSFAYDASGQLSTVTDSVGRNCEFTYKTLAGVYSDNSSRLTGIACSDGVDLSFAYTPEGYLLSVQRGTRVENYEYAPESAALGARYNLVKATDSNSRSFNYQYYTLGDSFPNTSSVSNLRSTDVVKKVQYPDLKSASFAYNLQTVNKRTVTDLRGNDTVYTLNYYGNPLRIDEPLGKTTRMTWSIDEGKNDNVTTSKTDPLGYITLFDYDPQGNVIKETDPYGNSITTTWNQKFSLPELRTDRNGVIQRWKYDLNGDLLEETDGDGKKTSYEYNLTGERKRMTDPRGYLTYYSYDQWGNLATVTAPEGSVTKYEYDVRGRRTASIDPKGRKTNYAYDLLDYPVSVTYPALSSYALPAGSTHVKATVYDAVGNLLSETDRLGLTLEYSYTPRNQVQTIRRNIGGVKNFSYDENGSLLSETDWKGIATTHGYDPLNRKVSTTNRLGHATAMQYDLNGNLTQLTDAEGRVTTYAYDKLNRLTDTWQPALLGQAPGHLVNTYYKEADPKANLKSETDQEGNSTTYEYNGRYLRSKKTDAAGGARLWAYDDSGNLAGETDEEARSTTFEYDKQNRRTKTVQPGGTATVYAYDLAGNRTHVIDPRGNDTETKYDEWNRPWQVVDPDHYVSTTELDGEGNQVRAVDGNGNVRSWTRDQRGLVLSGTDAEWNTTTFGYDPNGNKTSITDANGTITKVAYDAEDRQTLTTEAVGQPEERTIGVLAYDKVGNALQAKDGNGNVTLTEYNALNLPAKVTDPLSHSTETGYYRTAKPKTVRNRRGAVTAYEYDQLNRLVKVTDPLLQTTVNGYDKVGNLRTVADKRGIVSETIYDELNRPIEKRRANVRLLTNEYDGAGNLTAVIDANDNRTESSYGKRNLLESVLYPDNSTRKRSYDGVGNLLTETDEEGKVTSYTYDKENRQTSVELAGEKTDKVYDAIGNLIAEIKPESNSRTMEYDRVKRLSTVTEASLTTRYEYDKNGNLLNQYDPKGNRVEYTWDELNRKSAHIQHKASGNLITAFQYDEEGNLLSQTDPKGQSFSYVYDLLNRRTDESYPLQSTPFMTLTAVKRQYDPNNNLTSIDESKNDSQGGTATDSTVNVYDEFDRLTSSTQRGVNVAYGYDANGNRTSVGTSSGSTVYTYDKRNRVQTAKVGSATTSFVYYPDGKKKTVTYPNGAGIAYAYYPSNRVKTVTNTAGSTTISSYAYSYDKNGNRLTQAEVQNGGSTNTNYSYDTLDRMTGFTAAGPSGSSTNEYTFDGYNRATEKVTAADGTVVTKNYSYDETNWLTRVDDGAKVVDYSYDANGNTVRKSDSSNPGNDMVFQYDSANRLVRSMRGTTLLGLYDYDADGMRIRHRNSDRGDVDYFYDGRSVIEERTVGGTLLARYNYADRLMSLATGSDTQYYHFDALGSTVNLTDAAGATKVSYFLNPWGMILSQIGDSTNRHVFTGKEQDNNTKLVYFGARYYDPDTGRFISQDSYLGQPGTPPSLHRYLYAYSNPTVYIDLYGYESIFSDAADALHRLKNKSKDYISKLNKKADKGLADRTVAAFMGIGNTIIDGVAGAAQLADLSTDVSLAINPATKGTVDGEKARARVKETTTNVAQTAKKAYTYVTTEDPSAMVQTAKEKLTNYVDKTFVEGDLNYTADFSGKAFGVALGGASARAAQTSKAASVAEAATLAEQAAIRETVLANVAESQAARSTSGFAKASQSWASSAEAGESVAGGIKAETLPALSPWPPNAGAIPGTTTRRFLMPGEEVDRYGFSGGTYVSPVGTPLEARALRPGTETRVPYNSYTVKKPIEVNESGIMPWFGKPGLGTQYELPVPVKTLLKRGFLE